MAIQSIISTVIHFPMLSSFPHILQLFSSKNTLKVNRDLNDQGNKLMMLGRLPTAPHGLKNIGSSFISVLHAPEYTLEDIVASQKRAQNG